MSKSKKHQWSLEHLKTITKTLETIDPLKAQEDGRLDIMSQLESLLELCVKYSDALKYNYVINIGDCEDGDQFVKDVEDNMRSSSYAVFCPDYMVDDIPIQPIATATGELKSAVNTIYRNDSGNHEFYVLSDDATALSLINLAK